jgi:hypothetical protein
MANPYGNITVNTTKGYAAQIAGRSVYDGNLEKVVWSQTGIAVDRDTVTIDGTVFELVELATDSTFDVGTSWDNTNAQIQQTLASHTLVVGQYVAVNNEVARVIFVGSNDVVGFQRGVAGSTIVAHGTGTDPINVQSAVALTAGAVTVPLDATTAENTIDRLDAIVAEKYWLSKNEKNNFNWQVLKLDAATALLHSTVVGNRGATFAEALSNGTVLPATGEGGSAHGSSAVKTVYRAPTAAEVTDGNIRIICPWKPVNAIVTVFTSDTDGTEIAWDGGTTFDLVNNIVTLDNGGAVDWAASNRVAATIFGAPQTAEETVSE